MNQEKTIDFSRLATGIGSLETAKARFILVEEVRDAAGWDMSHETSVVALYVQPGHFRLLQMVDAQTSMSNEQAVVRKRHKNPQVQEAALQTIRDRYQQAWFQPKDGHRVELREETMLSFLGGGPYATSLSIFLQVGEKAIDVMTLAVRQTRLTKAETENS